MYKKRYFILGLMLVFILCMHMLSEAPIQEPNYEPMQRGNLQTIYSYDASVMNLNYTQEMLDYYLYHPMWEGTTLTTEDIKFVLIEDISQNTQLTHVEQQTALIGQMSPYVDAFMQADKAGIKFECITTIAAMETGYFTSSAWQQQNNAGGITRSVGGYATYESPDAGIQALQVLLTDKYISPDGCYYVGENMNVMGLAQRYNTNDEWVKLYVQVRLAQYRRVHNEY